MKTVDTQGSSFDFEAWCQLAKRDPEAFEAQRRAAVEEVIARAPGVMQQRLRGLQWRIDQERQRSKSATSACVQIYRMMWNRVYGQGGLLEALDGLLSFNGQDVPAELVKRAAEPPKSADVLQFRMMTQ